MQIHELTQRQLTEGLMDNLKSAFVTDPKYDGLDTKEKVRAIKQDQAVMDIAKKVMNAWNGYVFQLRNTVQNKDTFDKRQDGKYEDALRSFIQKNLFTGLPYARLTNLSEIETIIDELVKPLPPGSTLNSQGNLWAKLAQTAAVSQIVAQATPAKNPVGPQGITNPNAPGYTGPVYPKGTQPTTGTQQPAGDDPAILVPQVVAALGQAGVQKGSLPAMGKVATAFDPNQTTTLSSTGNVGVDAMLLAMGFQLQ
jgi:hypothetical protein